MKNGMQSNLRLYKIVFWSGEINFHTIQVLDNFAKSNQVIIAYLNRSFRGYAEIPVANCSLVNISSTDDILDLIKSTPDFIHINNAFKVDHGYELLKYALKILVRKKYTLISLFQEQYPLKGFSGLLRRIKWFLVYHFGLGRTHKLIGYCGQQAHNALRKAFVPEKKLVDFIYTPSYNEIIAPTVNYTPTFIMVGQLVPRKEVVNTISVFQHIMADFKFKIIGAGPQKPEIKNLIKGDPRFEFLGTLSPDEVQQHYASSDILILASCFDGWGCSVNEAINQGCKVLVSDSCGASSLVNSITGEIFHSGNWENLKTKALHLIKDGPLTQTQKCEIIKFSKNISPEIESNYLSEILNYTFNAGYKPTAPWAKLPF